MMMVYVTLGLQALILFTVSASCWLALHTMRLNRQIAQLIMQYRREIEWLTARMDTLERARQSQKVT